MERPVSEARKMSLEVNAAKTKYMCTAGQGEAGSNLTIVSHTFEKVSEFCYLGSQVNTSTPYPISISQEVRKMMVPANRLLRAAETLASSLGPPKLDFTKLLFEQSVHIP